MQARGSIRALGYVLIGVVAALGVESISFVATRFILPERAAFLFYAAPKIAQPDFEQYLQFRDPLLGWPSPTRFGGSERDASGSRYIPSFPTPGTECVSLYGDSFVYGSEVSHEKAWSNVLSGRLGCRVANFGVGGYGTDQAYLRFKQRADDRARVVLLGIYPEDILRNLTRYVYFLHGTERFSFKPRFEIENGQLSLVPLSAWTYAEVSEAVRHPQGFFTHEGLLPDSRFGPVTLSFPYTWRLLRAAASDRARSWMRREPSWIDFLDPRHITGALPMTVLIVEDFAGLARQRGKATAVVIFPTPASFKYFQDRGVLATQPLLDALGQRGIDYVELSQGITEYLGKRDYCELLTFPTNCSGHFNAEGNRVVADLVHRLLTQGSFKPE